MDYKTLTSDNGLEFARLSDIETVTDTKAYFTHSYSSFEKGQILHRISVLF